MYIMKINLRRTVIMIDKEPWIHFTSTKDRLFLWDTQEYGRDSKIKSKYSKYEFRKL